eukprot:TRINITY_DN73262_c0_g1_i1.p1 TRINITY_DN73262_c0_g1~~TRINITY_DN73262_c0_g1_i1.p1  ORF type:complete len:281 (+),score=117.96 TRINITY_DN73262_c0_g1_i1:64-906(+)
MQASAVLLAAFVVCAVAQDTPQDKHIADCHTNSDCQQLGDAEAKCDFGLCVCTANSDTTALCLGTTLPGTEIPITFTIVFEASCDSFFSNSSLQLELRQVVLSVSGLEGLQLEVFFSCGSVAVVVKGPVPAKDAQDVAAKLLTAVDAAVAGTELENTASMSVRTSSTECPAPTFPVTEMINVKNDDSIACVASACATGYVLTTGTAPAYRPFCKYTATREIVHDSDDDLNDAQIAAIVVGVVVFLMAVAGLLFFFLCKDTPATAPFDQEQKVDPTNEPVV